MLYLSEQMCTVLGVGLRLIAASFVYFCSFQEPRFCVVADLRILDVASFQYHREVVFVLAAQVGIRPSAPAVLRFISSLLWQWEC